MIALRAFLCLALLGAAPAQQAEQGQPTPATWYGITIGAPMPPGVHYTSEWTWPDGRMPLPWTEATVEDDDNGRVGAITLFDGPPIIIDGPRYPKGYVAPPTPIAELRAYMAAGDAVRAYAVARLGPPGETTEKPRKGEFRNVTLRWDFVERFVRCEGNTPVFKAPATEPSGLIATAELTYSSGSVSLGIVSKARSQDQKDERKRAVDECSSHEVDTALASGVLHGMKQTCADNPDRCASPIPGLTVIPAPGVTIVPMPCPKGGKYTQCFRGKKVEPAKKEEPAPSATP